MLNKAIFIDCHVFDGSFQGTTTFIHGIYQEMAKNSNADFYFAGDNIPLLESRFGKADNIHYIKYRYHNKFLRLLVDIPQILKQYKIDLAHFQYIAPPVRICPYIVTVHDVLFLDFPEYFPASYRLKNKFLFKWSAKRARIVTTVSEYSRQKIKQHFGIENIVLTPNAVEEVFFEDYNKKSIQEEVSRKFNLENYIIYISRHEPRKNHRRLLQVFADEFAKEYQLLFIGDKAIPDPEFDHLYASLPVEITSKIKMLGKVAFPDMLMLLRGAAVSVYPSVAEGFGIPPLEAAAAQIPSVCSNTTAMADFSILGDALFDPLNEKEMAQKIRQAMATADTAKISEAVRETFNWKKGAAALWTAIEAIG